MQYQFNSFSEFKKYKFIDEIGNFLLRGDVVGLSMCSVVIGSLNLCEVGLSHLLSIHIINIPSPLGASLDLRLPTQLYICISSVN